MYDNLVEWSWREIFMAIPRGTIGRFGVRKASSLDLVL